MRARMVCNVGWLLGGGYRPKRKQGGGRVHAIVAIALSSLIAGRATAADHGQQCENRSGFSVMYEEGRVAPEHDSGSMQTQFAAIGGRWLFTATDGIVAEGQSITLTYSFVPDGTVIPGYNGEPQFPSNLFASLDAEFPGGRSAWKAVIATCFDRFAELTNITYVEVGDDGADYGEPGELGARGDIRIAMHPVGDGPLAYNFYPILGGDMVLDSLDLSYFTNPVGNFRNLRNVLMHEHGHGLGLGHVLPQNGTKLMEPALNTGFDGPQEDDIRAIQYVYGDWAEQNDEIGEEEFVGGTLRDPSAVGVQELLVEDVALERADSSDWFAFTALGGAPVAIRVEPVGTQYQFAPEGGQVSPVDAAASRDLGFRLWRRVSEQTNQLQLLGQIDFNEVGADEYHPPLAYTIAGYMLVEVFSTDNIDDVQRYRLTISNTDIEAETGDPRLFVADGLLEVPDGETMLFGPTAVGETDGVALTVRNIGDGPLHFTGLPQRVTVQGPAASDFVVAALPAELPVDGTAILGITFAPTAPGQRVALVTIPNDDPQRSEYSFIVSGTATEAIQPVLAVSESGELIPHDSSLALGTAEIGVPLDIELTLTNDGNGQLSVFSSASFNGPAGADFAVAGGLPVTLLEGESSNLLITYTPSQAGAAQATLGLPHNGAPSPYRITLTADVEGVDLFDDCNGNDRPDHEDIADGFSPDCDGNGVPDECEQDSDGDNVIDACDECPGAPDQLDGDGDSIVDCLDNCPQNANADQIDSDGDGVGDACDTTQVEDPIADNEPEDDGVVSPPTDQVGDENEGDTEGDPDDQPVIDEQEQEKDEPVQQEDQDLEDDAKGSTFCGAGAIGMIPMMFLGMSGLKLVGRRRRRM